MNTQREANDFDFSKKMMPEPIVKDCKYSRAMVQGMSTIGNFINKVFKNRVTKSLCAFLVLILILNMFFSSIAEKHQMNKAQEKAQTEKIVKKIASIPQPEFEKMMAFVKEQLTVGEKVAARGLFAGDYMMKNRKSYNIDYILEKKSNIIKYQREHEKFVYSRITLLNEVYEKVNNKEIDNIEFVNLERFITWLGYYKNNEKYINENLREQVDHIVVNTDITDEINKRYPDPLTNN